MTLNGAMAVILRYFTEFRSFVASYAAVTEVRPYCRDKKLAQKSSFRQYMLT